MKTKSMLYLLIALIVLPLSLGAQNKEVVEPFSRLSAGLELNTLGFGLQVATPINGFFGLRAGYMYAPNANLTGSYYYGLPGSSEIDNIINNPAYPNVKRELEAKGLPTRTSDLPTSIEMNGQVGMSTGKLLVDYYPTQGIFHLTAGLFFGSTSLLKGSGGVLPVLIDVYDVVDKYAEEYGYTVESSVEFGNEMFSSRELMNVEVTMKTNAVRPYFGIGFGRQIPKKRIGVNFELGAMYMGSVRLVGNTDKLTSAIDNELEDAGVKKYFSLLSFYPMLSLKLNGRIF